MSRGGRETRAAMRLPTLPPGEGWGEGYGHGKFRYQEALPCPLG